MVLKMKISTKVETEANDVTKIPDSEVSTVVEHSEVVEVLEEISFDRWNPLYFGETPRKVEDNGNSKVFWKESIEPPKLGDAGISTRI